MDLLNSVEWGFVITKLIFIIPVGVTVLWALKSALVSDKAFDYPRAVFILLATWLSTEAISIVLNKFENPIRREGIDGINDTGLGQLGGLDFRIC